MTPVEGLDGDKVAMIKGLMTAYDGC